MRRIGIDVGGTNTDAVLIDNGEVLRAVKAPTSEDVTGGIIAALSALRAAPAGQGDVDSVMIGTTHFVNAIVQRRSLSPVGALRIGDPVSGSLMPFCDWPGDLAQIARGGVWSVGGGHEYDGRPILPLDEDAVREAAIQMRDQGLTAIAIASIFSPIDADHEQRAAFIISDEIPDAVITLSSDLGRIGLLERENVALLNAALSGLAVQTINAFEAALHQGDINAPLYITQNDGTVVEAATAIRFPVYSFASGATNSMRGAAYLSSIDDAIVVDVGGTTTDVGQLVTGFPRESNTVVEIGGVRTLFRMPELLSFGLGGGSHVCLDPLQVGPLSVGYQLIHDGLIFGGSQLTATDIAVAHGLLDLGNAELLRSINAGTQSAVLAECERLLEEAIDRVKTRAGDTPLIAVGGGAFLVPDQLRGVSDLHRVVHGDCANAVGAAIAQVSGEVDQIFRDLSRTEAIEQATKLATLRALEAGAAEDTLTTIETEDMPLSYLPGNSLRVRVRRVGDVTGS
ncbi:MAG: hydantoinase/oxoprolinase family protein [Arenicellales bacterium]|nr:hydantoinase/oxoprolinase family protein [Arenicellales bacterium]MDP7192353.1 hydantoinase/oxoprolinase family protein [Arenicellales bacterium]